MSSESTSRHQPETASTSETACAAPLARLREVRALVRANNRSSVPDEVIVCQIWNC
jgi:hypothetical protein